MGKGKLQAQIQKNFDSLSSDEEKLLFSLICLAGCAASKLDRSEFKFLKVQFCKRKELQKLSLQDSDNRIFLRQNIKAFIIGECGYPKKEFDKCLVEYGLGTEEKPFTGFDKFGSDPLGFETVQAVFGISAFINKVCLSEHLKTFLKDQHKTDRSKLWPLNYKYVGKLVSSLLGEQLPQESLDSKDAPRIEQPKTQQPLRTPPTSNEDWLSATNETAIPFIGREAELAALNAFAQGAPERAKFQLWAVVGASGAGKTRLLNHWSLGLQQSDWMHIKISPDTQVKWLHWSPECPTLLSIDYIYGYDEIISAIISRAHNTEFDYPVRLLLLDHATPDSMKDLLRDPRWGYDERGSDNFLNCFFNDAPLKLVAPDSDNEEQSAQYEHFLAQIICAVAFQGDDNPSQHIEAQEIQRGLTYLKKTTGAKQALFAALVGNAIRQKKENAGEASDYLTLNRRELIEHYFQGSNRLTWKFKGNDKNTGKWAACAVATATAIRGANFRGLVKGAPEEAKEAIENTEKFKSLCNGIVSGNDNIILKAYQPDILGETFFLKFLEACPDMEKHLPTLLIAGAGKDTSQSAVDFVTFITRLARNLSNDDQNAASTVQAWEQLVDLLRAQSFTDERSFRWSVSLSCFEIYRLLDEKEHVGRANEFLGLVNEDGLYRPPMSTVKSHHIWLALSYNGLLQNNAKQTISKDLKRLLSDWDRSESKDYNSLMLAMWASNTRITRYLMRQKNDFTEALKGGTTALMFACRYDQRSIAMALVEKNAALEAQDDENWTPLMFACRHDQPEVAMALVKKNAALEAQDDEKWTALMYACRYGLRDVAMALVEKNAALDEQNDKKWTALMFACRYDQPDVAMALVEKNAALDAQDDEKWTALMFACRYDQPDVAMALVKKNAALEAQNDKKWTALMFACSHDQPDIAMALVEKKAALEAQNDEKWTALMYACRYDQRNVAIALVEKNAALEVQNDKKWTALMIACRHDQPDVAMALVEKNAALDARDDNKWTALMFACLYDQLDVAMALMGKKCEF